MWPISLKFTHFTEYLLAFVIYKVWSKDKILRQQRPIAVNLWKDGQHLCDGGPKVIMAIIIYLF